MKENEKRLSEVVGELLAKAVAEEESRRKAEAARAREEAAAVRVQRARIIRDYWKKSPSAAASTQAPALKFASRASVSQTVRSEHPESPGVGSMGKRGAFRSPVDGRLTGRFGAQWGGPGTTRRGVFISAGQGAQVRAVASGKVVYSDWLRGYGNLVIVDHGDGYLSIYGNNDALYKQTGAIVIAGEPVASVGTSGVEAESGLYFELRHRGQAVDPMRWIKFK